MEQQSIDRVKKRLIEDISRMDSLPLQDRVELMINLLHFLNDYEENIEVLQKHKTLKLGE
jgi:hypothetical protein